MSRTKRHIPHWASATKYTPWDLTMIGLGREEWAEKDPRNRYENGYDGISPTYYHSHYPPRGWRENYQGRTRQFFKRKYHKDFRQYWKKEMERWED